MTAAPPGWVRLGEDEHGTPIWRYELIATLQVATADMDLLRCMTATLLCFRHRTPYTPVTRLIEPKDF